MKYLPAFVFLSGLAALSGCDQLEHKQSPGEIIVIGNGILNLNESDGVIADVASPDGAGLVSVIVSPSKTEDLVRDRATNRAIPTYYNWATSGEKRDPVLSLDIKDLEKKCRYFESLQNGDLVCRRDLESLDISPISPPQFSRAGEVFFLDSNHKLLRLWQGKLAVISDQVYRFAVDRDSNLLFWRLAIAGQKLTPHLWRNGSQVSFRSGGVSTDIEFIMGKDRIIYLLYLVGDPAHAPGLYKWVWSAESLHPIEMLVQAWPREWSYKNRTVDSDSEMLVVRITKLDSTQALVQVSELGMRLLEDKTLQESAPMESSLQAESDSASEVQKLGNAFISKNRKQQSFSYCRSDEKELDQSSRCQSITSENAQVLDLILKSEGDVYVLAIQGELRRIEHHRWDQNSQNLLRLSARDLSDPIVRFRTPTEKLSAATDSQKSKLVTGD